MGRCAGVEHPVIGTGRCGLEGEAGQGLVQRRRKLADGLVLSRQGLLGLDARASTQDTRGRLHLGKSRDRPGLNNVVPGVVPGGGGGSAVGLAAVGRAALVVGGAGAAVLLLALPRTVVAGGLAVGLRSRRGRGRRGSGGRHCGRSTGGARGGEQGGGGDLFGPIVHPGLLLEEERSALAECHPRASGGDVGDAVAELVVEVAEEANDEVRV